MKQIIPLACCLALIDAGYGQSPQSSPGPLSENQAILSSLTERIEALQKAAENEKTERVALSATSASDFAPVTSDSQAAINTALLRVNEGATNDPSEEFIPVAFARYPKPKATEWHEYQARMPGAYAEVGLVDRVRRDFQEGLNAMFDSQSIDAFLILYQKEGHIHLILQDTDGTEKHLVADRPKNLDEKGSIKFQDFKPDK